jgi:predicted flap endonuclease-1-like 5' DNA nuclease
MLFNYILLQSTFQQDLPVGLALCIVPFILGWLAAMMFYKVSSLRGRIEELEGSNASLTAKVDSLHTENTELRVKITQLEADLDEHNNQIRKLKNDLIICESEKVVLEDKLSGGGKASKAKAAAEVFLFAGTKYKKDDLKIVEGIGPKIEELLHKAGIYSWESLAESSVDRLNGILEQAGSDYAMHDPGSWPQQAGLAANQDWDTLKKLQDELKGGR